jgi:glutamate synthase (NADPH/NADH)
MDDLRNAHVNEDDNKVDNDGISSDVVLKNGISKQNGISAVNQVWGGDKRIGLFGYTIETINLLLLPMIKTK